MKITQEQKNAELEYVKKNDTKVFDTGETVYIVSAAWINNWKKFVQSDAGVHPGPVDNSVLLDRDQRPLRNLSHGSDYRGVNQKIWEHWVKIYGGGPEVRVLETFFRKKSFRLWTVAFGKNHGRASLRK